MKAVRYDQLIDNIRIHVPACTDGLILRMTRQIAQEFCRRSECWREKVTVDLVANQAAYSIASSFVSDIRRIATVWLRSTTDVAQGKDGYPYNLAGVRFEQPGTLTFLNTPSTESVTGGLRVELVLTPAYNADEIGNEIIELWGHAIEDGVIARLKAMPKLAWSDPQGAKDWGAQYDNGISQASFDTEKRFTGDEVTVSTPRWLV